MVGSKVGTLDQASLVSEEKRVEQTMSELWSYCSFYEGFVENCLGLELGTCNLESSNMTRKGLF